jgi:seryl-tRNA synthetase
MLQVTVLRANAEEVKKKLQKKNFKDISLVDEIISLDDQRKKIQSENDELLSRINAGSKEIGALIRTDKEAAEAKKTEIAALKTKGQQLQDELTGVEKQIEAQLVKLPNLPHET